MGQLVELCKIGMKQRPREYGNNHEICMQTFRREEQPRIMHTCLMSGVYDAALSGLFVSKSISYSRPNSDVDR
jgi:hypothetical protein